MSPRIAVFGGSFNPPGLHHRAVAEGLAPHFDELVVVPCGPRPDKPTTNDVEAIHRAAMADLTFRGIAGVRVDLFDLEQSQFTRTHRLEEIYRPRGEVWHVIGTDLIRGGGERRSFIQRFWENGETLWRDSRFAVVERGDFHADPEDLPSRRQVFRVAREGASQTIRERVFRHQDIGDWVSPEVGAYIERYGLYRGRPPSRSAPFRLDPPRPMVVVDETNPRAVELGASIEKRFSAAEPNCLAVVGGDGTMLHAIRKHWRLRLPFVGINTGHRGFLLNGAEPFGEGRWPEEPMVVRQSPLLCVESIAPGSGRVEPRIALAFNDAWVERRGSQTAWIEVAVNGETRLSKLVGDGVLVATAAGSTAYARAMGATPLLFETPALILVGSNVMEPPAWKAVLLALDSLVEFRSLSPEKRPLAGFVDGVAQGDIERMRVRVSRIASAELAFCRDQDMAKKIADLQFPPG